MLPSLPLYGAQALREMEASAISAAGGDAMLLMQRAGQAAWREVLAHWPDVHRIGVLCGPGNNGGDGWLLAFHARQSGRAVRVIQVQGHAPRGELAARARQQYVEAGGVVETFDGGLPEVDLLVDALFGIGLDRAPDADVAAVIEQVNASGVPVLALDVPSGLDADSGHAPGMVVCATRTLEFIAPHPGNRTGAAVDSVGTLSLATLEVDGDSLAAAAPAAGWLLPHVLADAFPPRMRNAHKGRHGHVLCVGGDHGAGGAILMCAEAALRSGAGLSSVLTRSAHVPAVLARRPECMVHAVDDIDASGLGSLPVAESVAGAGGMDMPRSATAAPPAAGLAAARGAELPVAQARVFARADVIAVGPGLGTGEWGRALLAGAIAAGKPLVLDADALTLLAAGAVALPSPDAVLTPHPGEAARLLSTDIPGIERDRIASARALAEHFACVVVLKGAGSIVAGPGRVPLVIAAGNPGMAVGGMGDVLTGIIASLRGQGWPMFEAAALGALLHATAADHAAAAGERGLLPTDLFPALRTLVNPGKRPDAPATARP